MSAPSQTDRDLADAYAAGDPRAIGPLFLLYRDLIRVVAIGEGVPYAEVDDVVGEVAELLVRRLGKWRGDGAFPSWLRVVVVNRIRTMHESSLARERRNRLVAIRDETRETVDPADRAAAIATTTGALAALPAAHREVLWETYGLDADVETIAAHLGIPEGTVKSRRHRAEKTLRGRLEGAA